MALHGLFEALHAHNIHPVAKTLRHLHAELGADGKEKQNDNQEKGENVEVIEPPEIAQARGPRNRSASFGRGTNFMFETQNFVFPKTEVGAAKFKGMEFLLPNQAIHRGIVDLEETFDFLRGKEIIHFQPMR